MVLFGSRMPAGRRVALPPCALLYTVPYLVQAAFLLVCVMVRMMGLMAVPGRRHVMQNLGRACRRNRRRRRSRLGRGHSGNRRSLGGLGRRQVDRRGYILLRSNRRSRQNSRSSLRRGRALLGRNAFNAMLGRTLFHNLLDKARLERIIFRNLRHLERTLFHSLRHNAGLELIVPVECLPKAQLGWNILPDPWLGWSMLIKRLHNARLGRIWRRQFALKNRICRRGSIRLDLLLYLVQVLGRRLALFPPEERA